MGSPTNPGGRLLVSSSIQNIGVNRYRLTVNLAVKSSLTWNAYGINCYAHIGGSKTHLGTFMVPQGTGKCVPNTYTHEFNVTGNTEVYASCICTHCDGSDGWSGRSNSDTAHYVNPNSPPPTPTLRCLNYAAPGRYLLENTLDVELSEVRDPDGDTVRYVIYAQYKTSSGQWASAGDINSCILYSTTERKVSVNVEKYPRGTQFKIWGRTDDAVHGVGSPDTPVIENIYRKQAPTAPVLSCTNPQFKGKYIAESTINVKLSNSTDPENIGSTMEYYICGKYKTPSSDEWVSMGEGNDIIIKKQTADINIEKYERGTQFKIWGYAIDNHGSRSNNSNEIENIYRNRKPNKISSISPASKTIIGDTAEISWTASTDVDGQPVTYTIWIKVDEEEYFLITGNIKETRYSMDISSYKPGAEIKFKIIPNDGMVDGDPTISPLYKKDFPPSFILPINNATLYQTNPRVVAKRMKGSDVFLHVTYDNVSFNSNNNADRFRQAVKTLSDGVTMCFNPVLQAGKKTTITIYSVQKGFESSRVTLDITINSISVDLDSSIKKSDLELMINAINKIKQSYKLKDIPSITIVAGETKVDKSHVDKMTNGLEIVRNAINEYDSNKISTNWNNNPDKIIRKTDFRQVLDAISNV